MWQKVAVVWVGLVLFLTGCIPGDFFDFPCGLENCGDEKGARFVPEVKVEKDFGFYFNVYTDRDTGCKYLTTDVGVTPLMTEEGKPDCDPKRIQKY
ncbi:DUF6440 family protein [Kroppenstedtia eburnea]|uniref:DUF6440 family protein n=1 Tax=Kroppenstedtia eburnea TaxID=714067 RepID=UPI003641DDB9